MPIRLRRRPSGGAAGAPSGLQQAEPAFNEADNTLYLGIGTGGAGGSATSVIPIGGAGAFVDRSSSQSISGFKQFTTSPQAPTPAPGDSSGNVATTSFVQVALGSIGGSQAANTVYAGPSSGANAAPSYRALVPADIPSIPSSKLSDLGSANGAASLGGDGKIPSSQLPSSVLGALNYKGSFSAAGGAYPSSPSKGDYYVISTAGTISGHVYSVGDWITYDGTTWDYIDNSTKVSSVFGRVGAVIAAAGDYTSDQITEGTTNLYVTAARVLATAIAGVSSSTNAVISASDTILSALGKLQAQVTARLVASNNLSDLTSVTSARSNLGLGTMATQNASAIAVTGGTLDSVTITNSTFDGGTF